MGRNSSSQRGDFRYQPVNFEDDDEDESEQQLARELGPSNDSQTCIKLARAFFIIFMVLATAAALATVIFYGSVIFPESLKIANVTDTEENNNKTVETTELFGNGTENNNSSSNNNNATSDAVSSQLTDQTNDENNTKDNQTSGNVEVDANNDNEDTDQDDNSKTTTTEKHKNKDHTTSTAATTTGWSTRTIPSLFWQSFIQDDHDDDDVGFATTRKAVEAGSVSHGNETESSNDSLKANDTSVQAEQEATGSDMNGTSDSNDDDNDEVIAASKDHYNFSWVRL